MGLKLILKTLTRDDGVRIVPKLERHLLKMNWKGNGDGWIHPSGVGYCVKAQFWNLCQAPFEDKIDPLLRRIFDNGTYFHIRTQKYLLKAGIMLPNPKRKDGEWQFEDKKHRIHGTADGLIAPKGCGSMLELKSIGDRGYSILGGPKHEHLWQTHLYMNGLKQKRTHYIYENKNSQLMREFVEEFDPEIFNTIWERVLYINKCFETLTIPTKWVTSQEGGCSKCKFSNVCSHGDKWIRENKKVLKKLIKTGVKNGK